jgi:hypothetical protein
MESCQHRYDVIFGIVSDYIFVYEVYFIVGKFL